MRKDTGVSVIIPTYNRSALLKTTIKSLINQTASKESFEIIVVDNNSTDDTKTVVKEFIRKYPQYKIRYIQEKKQGLSYSKNTGLRVSEYSYITYLDDDAKADRDWIKNIITIIKNENLEMFGGPIYPFYKSEKPQWFKDTYETVEFGKEKKELKENEYLSSSNFVVKKDLIQKLGGFNHLLGMKGEHIACGEETEIIVSARKKFKDIHIYYDPELIVYHLVPSQKMRVSYKLKRSYYYGKSRPNTFHVSESIVKKILLFGFAIANILFKIVSALIYRNKKKYPYFENYLVEVISPSIYTLGVSVS